MDRFDILRDMGYEPTGDSYDTGATIIDLAEDENENFVVARSPHQNEFRALSEMAVARELEILDRLKGLPVPELLDVAEVEMISVVEYVPGGNFYSSMSNQPSLPEVIEAIMHVSGALAEIHESGHVYGDAHFGNFIKYQGATIIDLVSCGTEEEYKDDIAIEHQSPWSPPELYSFKPLTRKSDVFSLGMNAYTILKQMKANYIDQVVSMCGHSPILAELSRDLASDGILNNDAGMLFAGMMEIDPSRRPSMKSVHKASKQLLGMMSD